MRNNVKAYKVLTKAHMSAIITGADCVRYPVDGSLVKPHKSCNQFLFIFDLLENARYFQKSNLYLYEVWEVRANNVDTRTKNRNGAEVRALNNIFPVGTMFCSSLRVIKKVC